MEKKFFLFLLSLCVCGAINVKAQVRIGGDNAPHPAAVLDLNPGNTADAKGGLLFPRVSLDHVEDSDVFGAGIDPVPGLVVYNTNEAETELGDLVKGLYVWDGREWLFVGGESLKETPYGGFPFRILGEHRRLWFGRDGDLEVPVDLSTPDLSGYKVKYTWYFKDKSESIVDVVTTSEPLLRIPNAGRFTKGRIYRLYCEVSLLGFKTGETYVGSAVFGTGAWIGQSEWLNVANANVGAEQQFSLYEQLAEDHKSAYNRTVMGDRFQWGRLLDGHEYMTGSGTYSGIVPTTKLDNKGTPTSDDVSGKFILNNGDWREYPSNMTEYLSNGQPNIDATNPIRLPWYWRTVKSPTLGVDPCSPAMDGFPGKWFVMAEPHWDSIRKYNRFEWLDMGSARGVAVYPNKDLQGALVNVSFYFPIGAERDGIGGDERPKYMYSNYDGWYTSLWLNSYGSTLNQAVRIRWTENSSPDPVKEEVIRTTGLPIRCVAEEF